MKAKAVLKGGSGRDFLGSLAQVNLATKIQMLHMILQLVFSQSVNEVCRVLTKAYFEKERLNWVNLSGSLSVVPQSFRQVPTRQKVSWKSKEGL